MIRPDLPGLTAFIAIAEHGSFSGAARVLGVSSSALSHSMRNLEARLQMRLFNRTTRSVSLTEAEDDTPSTRAAPLKLPCSAMAIKAVRPGRSGRIIDEFLSLSHTANPILLSFRQQYKVVTHCSTGAPRMYTRQLGQNGPHVSAIGLGCMGMTDFYTTGSDTREAVATLHRALELGVGMVICVAQADVETALNVLREAGKVG